MRAVLEMNIMGLLQDLLKGLMAACFLEFEKLMQQPMYLSVVNGRRNKTIFYPLGELSYWVGKASF